MARRPEDCSRTRFSGFFRVSSPIPRWAWPSVPTQAGFAKREKCEIRAQIGELAPFSRDFVLPEDSVSSVVGRLATLPRTVLRRLTSAASRPALPASAHRTSNEPSRAAHSRGQRPHSDVCPCTSVARDESASHRSSPGRSALAIGRIRLKWARIGQSIAHLMLSTQRRRRLRLATNSVAAAVASRLVPPRASRQLLRRGSRPRRRTAAAARTRRRISRVGCCP